MIWDMDGTLVDVTGIRHLARAKEFDAFHEASEFCPPNRHVVEAARQSNAEGHINIICTGRMERHRAMSRRWLKAHGVPYAYLWMRPDGDFRKDFLVKRDMLLSARIAFDVVGVWDDRPSVIEMWESHGIPVTLVPGWTD